MFKKATFILFLFSVFTVNSQLVYSAWDEEESYTTLSTVDIGTFNEFWYRITDKYFDLRSSYSVNGKVDATVANQILDYAEEGLNYLPDSLANKNYYNYLKTAIQKGIKYPENSSNYNDIVSAIDDYLNSTLTQKVSGSVESYPSSWNAPLTVTLRWNVKDPTWTKLENYNYTWWINEWGVRKVIWNKISLNYVFTEEGNYSVFLDVTSNHKNSLWYPDVLPFSSRANIVVNEKIASIILKVNSDTLGQKEELKFTPDEAKYWLLFDATSSTPTSGTKFTKTTWDFGNGVTKTYTGSPNTERVIYTNEGEYTVTLELKTNENKTVEREFLLKIHNPIATIDSSKEDWYLGDKFTFTANPTSDDDLTYAWKIIDTIKDVEVLTKTASTFTYTFGDKWKYNVKLFVTWPSGDTDTDTKIIYINSRAPVADYNYSVPYSHKPNTVFLDATKSYDLDYTDEWNLKFNWIIDGSRVNLDTPNYNGSNGYYTFSSIGDHSVVLEVTDPDDLTTQFTDKVTVNSILSVDFFAFPRVTQIGKTLRFVSDSPEASFYEWDFGDGMVEGWKDENMTHSYDESWVYTVELKVVDDEDNENTFSKNVYIWDTDSPYAFVTIEDSSSNSVSYKQWVCNWEWAYILNRVDTYKFSWEESIDVTWESTWLSYSWKFGNELYDDSYFVKKVDDLWCKEVQLIVKSDKNWKESIKKVNVKVENILPTLSSLDVSVQDPTSDPVIVKVSALWAKDEDWIIQSYLWYYYTDLDSEPQDFRATKSNSTSFVIPKVTGNYYFVVVMKDNNEQRVDSEEISGSKYFITLTGDNVNTPLLNLSVDDNSVSIGEDIVFTSNVENILGQNLTNKVNYSWDFDGDGFYDKETTTPSVTHNYSSSWEKYAKLKVKYKGFSNTKTVTINISNILKPDFDYVSVWKDFVFFDNSLGQNAKYEWDFWDGEVSNTVWTVNHTYQDGDSVHFVKLRLTEWTKVKEVTKKVISNYSNIIAVRKEWLTVFSNFEIVENVITLNEITDKLYLYLWADSKDVTNYVADYNINIDSDLNWWDDDDEDNNNDDSYYTWESILIDIDESKEQTVRVYTKDINWSILETRDIKIVKEYISQEEIDAESIVFEWVSDSVKLKLEKLKQAVSNFPSENKLKWLMYVQKLKEEWNDNREKTNIILEFEWYIDEIQISWGNDLIDLLESLLIEWENDKSEKSIAYTALKNLIPTSISCIEWTNLTIWEEEISCYELLVWKLDVIGENTNIDENKELWSQILQNIAKDNIMTVKEKTDFKAILNTFVYGSVSNIPTEEKEVVVEKAPSKSDSWFVSGLLGFLKLVFIVILLFMGAISAFYIYYMIVNKNKKISFSEFITEKTSWKKVNKKDDSDELWDILWLDSDLSLDKEEVKDILNNKPEEPKKPETKALIEETNEKNDSKPVSNNSSKEDVPDWLKWNFETEKPVAKKPVEKKPVENIPTEIKKEEKKEVLEEKKEIPSEKIETPSFEKTPKEEAKSDWWVPDWLKWSFDSEEEKPLKEEKKEVLEEKKEVPSEKIETPTFNETPKEEIKTEWWIPDWLKWSFDSEEEKAEDEKLLEEPKEEVKKPEEKPEEKTKKETKTFDKNTKPATKAKTETISEEKKSENEPKLETKQELEDFIKVEENDNIPDWLKWSLEEKKPVKEKVIEEKPVEEKNTIKTEKPVVAKKAAVEKKEVAEKKVKKEPIKSVNSEKVEETKVKNIYSTKKETPKKVAAKKTESVAKKPVKKETIKKEPAKKEVTTKQSTNTVKETTKKDSKTKKTTWSELWEDWMKVPDWLQTEDDK